MLQSFLVQSYYNQSYASQAYRNCSVKVHFYADVLFQLAGTNVTREYQGHIVGINEFQESRALHVRTGRLLELISRNIYLCKKRLLLFYCLLSLKI